MGWFARLIVGGMLGAIAGAFLHNGGGRTLMDTVIPCIIIGGIFLVILGMVFPSFFKRPDQPGLVIQSTWGHIAKASFWIGVIASLLCCLVTLGSEKEKSPGVMGDALVASLICGVVVTIVSVPFVACIMAVGKVLSFLFRGFSQRQIVYVKQPEAKTDPVGYEDQRRREDSRARCDVLFAQHSIEIGARFTKEVYDTFVARHLGDDKRVEYVEQQAAELQKIILQHLMKVEVKPASPDAAERRAARAAVQSCYDENAHLLTESFPPIRFLAEMKARIPESASADAAWKQARKMILDLLVIIASEKDKRERAEAETRMRAAVKPPPARTINPDDLDFS